MRIYHFTIIFAVFALGMIIIADSLLSEKRTFDRMSIEMDEYVDEAVGAAAWELRASGTVFDNVTEERALRTFFYSLYASLDILEYPEKRREIQKYVPLLVISLNDGYYEYSYIPGGSDERPLYNYSRSELKTDGKYSGLMFAAYLSGYPMKSGEYSGFRASGSMVKERIENE